MRPNVLFLLVATCPLAPAAAAQPSLVSAQGTALPSGAAADVVRDVIKAVRENYVFPESAPAIVARLEQSLASGRYSTSNPATLAELISADMKEASGNDGHMYVNYVPAEAAAQRAGGPAGGQPQQPDPAFFRQMMLSTNYGITELKVLPGNVRYMNISQWFWDQDGRTRAAYDDALRFLRGGDAIIIDVRGNGGGAAEPVQYVASHFLDPGQKMMVFREGPDEVEEIHSQKVAPGKITGKPLYVLVGPGSASASEEFAAHIKNFRIGTLIGKTTAGAGNPNSVFPTAHGFVVSVSTGTAVHAVTNKGWEGEGISPDHQVELPRALDVAHLEALKARLATATPQQRPMLEWMIAGLLADGSSAFGPGQLRALAGRYQGNRMISERAGRLYWRLGTGPEQELIPLGGRTFAIGQKFGARAEFDPSGAAVTLQNPGTPPERLAKLGS